MSDELKFIVDECTGPKVAEWLSEEGFEVYSVYDQNRGWEDGEILKKAVEEEWIIISNDKDFGELVFKDKRIHKGVILLRLEDERASSKINVLKKLLISHQAQIKNQFIVLTEKSIRFSSRRRD